MSIILDAVKAFVHCKQKDKEMLQDYTRRLKVAREILHSHLGGVVVIQEFIENMAEYDEKDENKVKELTKIADEQFSSFVNLENSHQRKYGSVIKGLHTQKSL